MHSELWFVTNGVKVLSVFNDHKEADRELDRYKDDPDYKYYDYYGIPIDDLEDYPDELELALGEGFIG